MSLSLAQVLQAWRVGHGASCETQARQATSTQSQATSTQSLSTSRQSLSTPRQSLSTSTGRIASDFLSLKYLDPLFQSRLAFSHKSDWSETQGSRERPVRLIIILIHSSQCLVSVTLRCSGQINIRLWARMWSFEVICISRQRKVEKLIV